MSITVMKQALEAFEALQSHGDIAILVTPEREFNFARISKDLRQAIADAEKQEPVAFDLEESLSADCCPYCEALIHPQKQKPLTHEQILDLWLSNRNNGNATDGFARLIELAHGIKE